MTHLEPDESPTCSWKRGGDYCLTPVEKEDDLCSHHQELWQQMKAEEAKKKARKKPKPRPDPEPDLPVGPEDFGGTDDESHFAAQTKFKASKPNGTSSKKPSKYERQKALIRKSALATLESGRERGLTAEQVEVLYESLDVLGFLQEGSDR